MPAKPLTPEQCAEALAAVEKHGSKTAAAEALGIPRTTLRDRLKRAPEICDREAATISNQNVTPTAQQIRGVSTYYDAKGNVISQWVKTSTDRERQAEIMRAVSEAMKSTLPKVDAVVAPLASNSDLLSLYPITDYHLGMLAWREETGGEDWDTKIAEDLLIRWFGTAIHLAPASSRAVFANIGDFLHWDGLDAVTPQSKHVLDGDTRFAKLVRIAIRVILQIIRLLLAKHQQLVVIMCDANHDQASEVWLREWLAVYFADEPRITIIQSADSYYCVEHGNTALFFHHGHKRTIKDVDRVLTGKFPETFGRTKYRYAHTGHLHSDALLETPLMHVERHETLAAPDAYSSRAGYISGRSAKVITYSKVFGEVSRMTINPDMVRAS